MIYIIGVYIPEENKEAVKKAMFEAGGGQIGNYDSCCFEWAGQGQFRPLAGSDPAMGQHGVVETVQEVKVEMVADEAHVRAVIEAMRMAHPYETPAYHVLRGEDL